MFQCFSRTLKTVFRPENQLHIPPKRKSSQWRRSQKCPSVRYSKIHHQSSHHCGVLTKAKAPVVINILNLTHILMYLNTWSSRAGVILRSCEFYGTKELAAGHRSLGMDPWGSDFLSSFLYRLPLPISVEMVFSHHHLRSNRHGSKHFIINWHY